MMAVTSFMGHPVQWHPGWEAAKNVFVHRRHSPKGHAADGARYRHRDQILSD
jgi:hypothetical protein